MSAHDVDARVMFQWTRPAAVMLDRSGHLVLPAALPDAPGTPGVYRWTLHHLPRRGWNLTQADQVEPGQERSGVYIGEGGDLRTRIANYRRPSSRRTANRMHHLFVDHLCAEGTLTLEWTTDAVLTLEGSPARFWMARQTARRLVEDAALAAAYADDRLYVLNHDQGPKPGDRATLLEQTSTGWRRASTGRVDNDRT